jgi:arsenite methyltransferase
MNGSSDDVVPSVQAYYTRRLRSGSCCGASVAADTSGGELQIPSFGCGEPTAMADLRPGERVLDLGSGAGLDAFRAAQAVGPGGRVIGVDMTPAMLERAVAAAGALGVEQVEFREGRIEALPIDDASIDVVLSNCVINLSVDKAAVFREIERVLVPGGRMVVSDELVHGQHLHAPTGNGWCGCVDGAVDAASYAGFARAAGLVDVRIEPVVAPVPFGRTYSATVRAHKADIRLADADGSALAETVLRDAGLPHAGWSDPATLRWVLIVDGTVRGAIGLEAYEGVGLLRSLVVDEGLRGRGYARALLAVARRAAAARGITHLYGLTTTIPELLARWGFDEVERSHLPKALGASQELRGACPASARAFELCFEAGGEAAAADT